MLIAIVSGARPQFIKLAPIIQEMLVNESIDIYHIHTGQHYDKNMSEVFFDELSIPPPDINLNINNGTHAELVGRMLTKLEKELLRKKFDAILVAGDTDSTLAGGLVASKINIPVIHLESGLRSYDYTMPEEINRRVTDHISRLLITTTKIATKNLLNEGINRNWIFQTGDTMIDAIMRNVDKSEEKSDVLKKLEVKEKEYILLTLHRKENVDNKQRIVSILESIEEIEIEKVVYPIHPRTLKKIAQFHLESLLDNPKLIVTKPLGYLDFIKLEKNSSIILTDSGGIQKEALALNVPCVTLRDNTEWCETLDVGANVLVGSNKQKIVNTVNNLLNRMKEGFFTEWENPYGDGKSSVRITNEIIKRFQNGQLNIPTNIMVQNLVIDDL